MKTFLLLLAIAGAYVAMLAQTLSGTTVARFLPQADQWLYVYTLPGEIDGEPVEDITFEVTPATIAGHWSAIDYEFEEGDFSVTFSNLVIDSCRDHYRYGYGYGYGYAEDFWKLVVISPNPPTEGEFTINANGELYQVPGLVPSDLQIPEPKKLALAAVGILFLVLRRRRTPTT